MKTNLLAEIIKKRKEQLTVNNKYINTVNSDTVSDKEDSVGNLLLQNVYEPEAAAKELAKNLDDEDSFRYYLLLAKNNPIERLIEALSFVIEADTQGKIRTKKAIYFIGIIRRWGLVTKFIKK